MVDLLRKLLADDSRSIWTDDELRSYMHYALEWASFYFPEEGFFSWDQVPVALHSAVLCRAAEHAVFALSLGGQILLFLTT